MTQSIACKKLYIAFLPVLFMLLLTAVRSQAQNCGWSVTATSEPSTCLANGSVTATLVNAGSITGTIRYRLSSLTRIFEVPESSSPVFQNLAADQYKVVALGVCNGVSDSVSTTITVQGLYAPFSAEVKMARRTLDNCPTGRILVTLSFGKAPYTINITSKPAAYTGPVTFVTSNTSFLIDNLPAGNYSLNMTDDCSGAVPKTATVTSLPPMSTGFFSWVGPDALGTGCNQLINWDPYWSGTDDDDYSSVGTPLSYSIAYNGGAKFPYKPVNSTPDTVILPAGQTLKDAYGKILVRYIKTSCGQEVQSNFTIPTPILNISSVPNCDINFDMTVGFGYDLLCYPAHFTVTNNTTGISRDTFVNAASWIVKGLAYGSYTVTASTADGFSLQNTNWSIQAPPIASYSITSGAFEGPYGRNRAASFNIHKSTGTFTPQTRIDLISPSTYQYSAFASSGTANTLILSANGDVSFAPATYLFKVSDGCTTAELPITVTEDDVYNYSWSIPTPVQTCNGLDVTPTGTAMYKGISRPVYFTTGFGTNAGLPMGTPIHLTSSGWYTIGIGAQSFIYNYGDGVNSKTVHFQVMPLSVDINRSMGWVCPGLPADSGYMRIYGIGGSTASTGVYTYKLAAEGNGATGPYLATNTTGQFSTSASGGAYTLTKNQNYDIQIVDECGASVVQTIKIVDLTTAEIATANQAEYCLGDEVHLSVINLPSTAVVYQWTGPNSFSSTQQNPVVSPVTENTGGVYHVTISSDICKQPITADVNVVLASYITSCYSAVTDTSVNPYVYGLLGAWRPLRTYTYYGARAESDPNQATNIRKDGAFNDFMAFWQKQTDGWKAQTTDPNWVWNSQTTLFNKKGFELENKDPLGRYNAGIYGYDNAVPVAVIQNSHYCESTFDGFEDYAFVSSNCDDGKCPVDRRFNLSGATTRIVNTEYHTGRYSLKVTSADKDSIAIMMPVTATAADPSDPAFTKVEDGCPPYDSLLVEVKANKNVLLPPLSLLSGKKAVVSAWVKEAQDCKCTSYTNSQLKVVVKGADASGSAIYPAYPSGAIIDGWQRIEQVVDLPNGTEALSLILLNANGTAYFDDIRVHPYNANMKSFVYDAQNLRLMAELDENNYATFYEYDDDGTLTRVKKETERGVKTIKETRSALIKEAADADPNIEN